MPALDQFTSGFRLIDGSQLNEMVDVVNGLSNNGAVSGILTFSASLDVASVAANTSAEQTFTVTGLKIGDVVFVSKPSLSVGLVVGNARVSAANTVAITFGNLTAAPIDPGAETYLIGVVRPELHGQ
jgi:hypothetical protein